MKVEHNIHSYWYGLIDIQTGIDLQKKYLNQNNLFNIEIIGCEHHEVLSIGRSLWNKNININKGNFKNIHFTDRGGKLTLHNPGQLIIYPILNLNSFGLTLKEYICLLVKTSVACLRELGLEAQYDDTNLIGAYCNNKKIVSIGLTHKQGWVGHGLSINISNDLSKFKLFSICGNSETQVTSFLNEGINIKTDDVFKLWVNLFNSKIKSYHLLNLKQNSRTNAMAAGIA